MFAGQSQSEVNHVFIIYHLNVVGCWVGLGLYHVDIDVRREIFTFILLSSISFPGSAEDSTV